MTDFKIQKDCITTCQPTNKNQLPKSKKTVITGLNRNDLQTSWTVYPTHTNGHF